MHELLFLSCFPSLTSTHATRSRPLVDWVTELDLRLPNIPSVQRQGRGNAQGGPVFAEPPYPSSYFGGFPRRGADASMFRWPPNAAPGFLMAWARPPWLISLLFLPVPGCSRLSVDTTFFHSSRLPNTRLRSNWWLVKI